MLMRFDKIPFPLLSVQNLVMEAKLSSLFSAARDADTSERVLFSQPKFIFCIPFTAIKKAHVNAFRFPLGRGKLFHGLERTAKRSGGSCIPT